MRKLPEVEEAKALMTEAMDWSVFTWLFQKVKVRETADRANAALDKLNRVVRSRWSDEVKAAYKDLTAKAASHRSAEATAQNSDPEIRDFVKKVKEADEAARREKAKCDSLGLLRRRLAKFTGKTIYAGGHRNNWTRQDGDFAE